MWSVGCIMAELLTGQVLFPGTDRILSHQLILTSLYLGLGGHMTCHWGSHDLSLGGHMTCHWGSHDLLLGVT